MRERYNAPNYAREEAEKKGIRGKSVPPGETHAEKYYYKKQIDARTLMIITLIDGEEIEGRIEWYDSEALKINRENAPNLMLLKRHIKYMCKADDKNE